MSGLARAGKFSESDALWLGTAAAVAVILVTPFAGMAADRFGRRMGLVDDARWDAFSRKRDAVSRETERLKATWVNPRILAAADEALRARMERFQADLEEMVLRKDAALRDRLLGD